ncbi:hypothetical protein VTP01DRAFT_3633 [Rhizomucor pusillus]|uniref:uncharacterized protein n=1 Tax=Rhizomucor pusillus TaxID=4840 RepID=UPI003743F54A
MPNNSSIGYATYQQQDASGATSSGIASIILFFSIIFIILVSFVFYFWFTQWHKVPAQQRREEELEHQKEVDQLVENLKQQVKTVFRVPLVSLVIGLKHQQQAEPTTPISHEHRKVLAHKFYHLLSITLLCANTVALIILIGTTGSSNPSSSTLQASLFVFVLSINLYLITRQRCYYKERKQLFGSEDAHLQAVYKTRFKDWDTKLWSNWVQIAILIIEFFQLLTFPLRDFITVNSFADHEDESQIVRLVSIIMNAGGFMPDMRTPVWYTYSLWTAFAATFLSLLIAVCVHCINIYRPYKAPTRWVHWCIPVATLLYIPILTTFVSSAACQSLNIPSNDFAPTLRCNAPQISQQLYLWMSLFGYVVAYFLLTIFLTSYERIPIHNEIAFKSISVAFVKNMGLLLAIVFLLVESTTNKNRMRAILSITILLTMICYNIKARPCYVDKINFFRTGSFTCILWTSVLVAILSDTNAAQSLGPLAVICIIIAGWILTVLMYLLIYFIYYKQPAEYYVDENDDPWSPQQQQSVSSSRTTDKEDRRPPLEVGEPSTTSNSSGRDGWISWISQSWRNRRK